MVNVSANSGHTAYGLKEFIIDTKEDLEELPVDVTVGSTAFCIADSAVYMLNGSRKWVEI